ncbi:MAG: heme lyase CcmF/NrfE family subunit [Polyangiaceae bacterium]|nr:heme lyase CcmF/NrfE family subunit [Polyangiaceae bacterium]
MWQSLPEFGTVVLYAILAAAGYTLAVSLAAGLGRPRLLQAARHGAYGTIALIGLGVLTLMYGFVSGDYRLRYVSENSDRTMSTAYQLVALWGGQDGSWLWWIFLTGLFSAICIAWMGRRYQQLQPYVLATLMSVIAFETVLLIFAVAPFGTNIGGAPTEGLGLNYQLRTWYMIIHPPSLYVGFTSAAVPFGFCMAALVTGRLDAEWINATRRWMVFSWLFLSIGNILGMMWAYEELGWGGDWAWDPVENAACLPWWTASAYVHSTMIQERRGMFKIWNVFLIVATFWLTIFATFLTRSGMISSVHSFAKSSIGPYFLFFLGLLAATSIALVVWRIPMLKSENSLESPLSRETAFVLNNWSLLACCTFIAVATCWPLFSEKFLNYKSAVGPTFYNFWLPIPFIVVFALMCIAPLLGWRKTSPELFRKSFFWPTLAMVAGIALHFAIAKPLRMWPFVHVTNLYPLPEPQIAAGMSGFSLLSAKVIHYVGAAIAWTNGKLPLVVTALASFKLAVVVQEFARGTAARQRAAKQKNETEILPLSVLQLVWKSRRRYGGYIVHLGMVLVFVHFTGRAWATDVEASVEKGQTLKIDEAYSVRYVDTHMRNDPEKRSVISDVEVYERGKLKTVLHPAQNIYKSRRGETSTEIDRFVTARDDLYIAQGSVDPKTKIATFHIYVNPFAALLVFAGLIMIVGAVISMFPDVQEQEVTAFSYVRAMAGVATTIIFFLSLVFWPKVQHRPMQPIDAAWLEDAPVSALEQ